MGSFFTTVPKQEQCARRGAEPQGGHTWRDPQKVFLLCFCFGGIGLMAPGLLGCGYWLIPAGKICCARPGSNQNLPLFNELMSNTAAELPCDSEWIPKPQALLATISEWICHLHKAVDASPLCSWPQAMKPGDQGTQPFGVATLRCGCCCKFCFQDNECGDLLCHGTAVGNVLEVLPRHFRPRHVETLKVALLQKYRRVPPLIGFSVRYGTATENRTLTFN